MAPGEAELRLRERLGRLRNLPLLGGTRLSAEVERLEKQLARLEAEPTDDEIWRSVELSRHPERPYTLDYVERLLEDWVELHGDRGRAEQNLRFGHLEAILPRSEQRLYLARLLRLFAR